MLFGQFYSTVQLVWFFAGGSTTNGLEKEWREFRGGEKGAYGGSCLVWFGLGFLLCSERAWMERFVVVLASW